MKQLLKRLWLICLICTFGSTACISNIGLEGASQPELAFGADLQKALDQVLIEYTEYDVGISAAVSVPGHKTSKGKICFVSF